MTTKTNLQNLFDLFGQVEQLENQIRSLKAEFSPVIEIDGVRLSVVFQSHNRLWLSYPSVDDVRYFEFRFEMVDGHDCITKLRNSFNAEDSALIESALNDYLVSTVENPYSACSSLGFSLLQLSEFSGFSVFDLEDMYLDKRVAFDCLLKGANDFINFELKVS